MSTTIDNRVVSMQFDNRQFESNVKESMNTLEKLKHALKLDGASKGFDNLKAAANNFDLSKTEMAATKAGFHIQDVFEKATRFLENDIARRIVNVGEKIVKDFTVTPISTGFNEYELKMNSVQTILASTGESLETVNKYLDELNTYSDKTIYSFSDMTQNIGKFTNAGVKLEDAVKAIQGISNEAAVSGANANEASRAMYNFAQALSAGHVKLIDWHSIENANMATVEFKEQLIQTAVALGTLTDAGDGMYNVVDVVSNQAASVLNATHNFNDSLANQWMTTEVLTTTLQNYAADVREMTDAEKKAYEEKLRGIGYTEEQITAIEELGQKSFDSAQNVTTFSKMMDTLKETAQSGWAKTLELVFGDFDQAKKLWTGLTNFFSGIIGAVDDFRNGILEKALSSPFGQLYEKVKATNDSIKECVDTVTDYASVVDKIINGEFGSGQERWDKLTEAGYDWAHAQNLVNEKLGDATRHATEYVEAQNGVAEAQSNSLDELAKLSDAELTNIGYEEDQIKALRELKKQADIAGVSIDDFVKNIDKMSGRALLLDSFKNIGKSLVKVFNAVGQAWREIFYGGASDEEIIQAKADALYAIIVAFHKLTEGMKTSNDQANKIKDTFKGLFAALDIIRMLLTAGFRIAFQVIKGVLAAFNMNILDVTASIGRFLVKVRDWINNNDVIARTSMKVTLALKDSIIKVIELAKAFGELPLVQNGINFVSGAVSDLIDKIKSIDGSPITVIKDTICDFADSVFSYFTKSNDSVKGADTTLGEFSTNTSTKLEDITTSLTEFKESVDSTLPPVGDTFNNVKETVTTAVNGLKESLDKIDFEKVMAVLSLLGLFKLILDLNKLANGVEEVTESLSYTLKSFGKTLKAMAKTMKGLDRYLTSKAILNVAIAIGIIVASIWLLSKVDTKKAWVAIGEIGVIVVELSAVMAAMAAVSKFIGGTLGASAAIIAMSLGLILLTVCSKLINKMSDKDFERGTNMMWTFVGMMSALMAVAAFGKYSDKSSKIILKVALSLLLMVYVCKLASKLESTDILKAAGVATIFGTLIAVLMGFSMLATEDKINSITKLIGKVSFALLMIAAVCLTCKLLSASDIVKGLFISEVFVAIIGVLIYISNKYKEGDLDKTANLVTKVSLSLLLMAVAFKVAGLINVGDIPGIIALCVGFIAVTGSMIAISKYGKNVDKAAKTITAISIAMMAMASAFVILTYLKPEGLKQATIALGVMSACMAGIVLAAGKSKNVEKTIQSLAIALVAMAGALVVLSFLNPGEIVVGTLAMMGMMYMFTYLIKACEIVNTGQKAFLRTAITLGVLSGCLLAMAGALFLVGQLDPMNIAMSTLAMVSIMAMFILMVKATTYINTGKKAFAKALPAIITLGAIVSAMGLVISLLAKNDPESILASAAAMGIMMLSLVGAIALLGAISPLVASASAAVPAILGLAGAFTLLGIAILGIGAGIMLITQAFQMLGSIGSEGCDKAKTSLSSMISVFTDSIPAFIGSIAAGLGELVIEVVKAIGNIISEIAKKAPQIGRTVLKILKNVAKTAKSAIKYFIEVTKELVDKVLEFVSSSLPKLVQIAKKIILSICDVIISVKDAVVTAVTTIIIGLLNIVTNTIPTFVNTVKTFISHILSAITELAPKFVSTGFSLLKSFLTGLIENIGEIATTAVTVVTNFIDAVGEKIPDIIETAINFIFNFIDGLGKGIADNAAELRNHIITFCGYIWEAFCNFFGIHSPSRKFAEAGVNLILGLIEGIGSAIQWVINKIVEVGEAIVGGIGNFLTDMYDKGKELLNNLIDGIEEIITDVWDMGVTIVENIVEGIESIISEGWDIGKTIIKKLIASIKSWKDDLVDVGKWIVDGMTEGIKNPGASGKMKDSAGRVAQAAVNKLKEVTDEHSPSKVTEKIGKFLTEGLAIGIKSNKSMAENSAENVADGVLNTISDAMDKLEYMSDKDIISTPTIRPVMDMNSINTGRINLGADVSGYITKPVNSLSKILSEAQEDINSSNYEVINAINGLREDVAKMYESDDQEIALYVDSKKLATSLAKPMNRQLNILSQRGAY